MTITEIRIKLTAATVDDPCVAYCCVVFDSVFVIRDIKVIAKDGRRFVSMPSRKIMDHCARCRRKNHLRAKYCNNCGERLDPNRGQSTKLHADIAHPITTDCRMAIQDAILNEYDAEVSRSKQPGYRCRYEEFSNPG